MTHSTTIRVLSYATLIFGCMFFAVMKTEADEKRREAANENAKALAACQASRDEFKEAWEREKARGDEFEEAWDHEYDRAMKTGHNLVLCNQENDKLAEVITGDTRAECVEALRTQLLLKRVMNW